MASSVLAAPSTQNGAGASASVAPAVSSATVPSAATVGAGASTSAAPAVSSAAVPTGATVAAAAPAAAAIGNGTNGGAGGGNVVVGTAAAGASLGGSAQGGDSSASKPKDASAGAHDHCCDRLPHEHTIAESYEKDGAPVGEGTYGTVWRAKCIKTGRLVAMKRVNLRNEREGFPATAVREVRALRRLDHPNIVSLLDVCAAPPTPGSNSPGDAYLIFEYAPSDLTGLMAYRKQKLKPPEVKCITRQLVNALDFCHMKNIMHRDLKPSNILITAGGDVKLCDFGLCRIFTGPGNYSTRVITLWYRPPELLLGARHYDHSVDVWSAGCIFGELLNGQALFPENSEIRVFQKICERCGAMAEDTWPEELRRLPQWDKFAPKKTADGETGVSGNIFADLTGRHGGAAVELLKQTLRLDPSQRIGTDAFLQHPYFAQEPLPCLPSEIKINQHLSCHELDVKRHREKVKQDREEKEAQRQQMKRTAPVGGGGQSQAQAPQQAAQAQGGRAATQDASSPKRQRPG